MILNFNCIITRYLIILNKIQYFLKIINKKYFIKSNFMFTKNRNSIFRKMLLDPGLRKTIDEQKKNKAFLSTTPIMPF